MVKPESFTLSAATVKTLAPTEPPVPTTTVLPLSSPCSDNDLSITGFSKYVPLRTNIVSPAEAFPIAAVIDGYLSGTIIVADEVAKVDAEDTSAHSDKTIRMANATTKMVGMNPFLADFKYFPCLHIATYLARKYRYIQY